MTTFAVSTKMVAAYTGATTHDDPVRSLLEYTKQDCESILQSSPLEDAIVHSESGFVFGAIQAYNQHHNLSIRPDDVWLAITIQFGLYVNGHAEDLRHLFVRHEGQKELTVKMSGSMRSIEVADLAAQMLQQMDTHLADPALRAWLLPCFSTTTEDDKIVGSIVLMAAMKKYFTYKACLACGIPFVTLLGTVQDWEDIRARVDKLAAYGDRMTEWSAMLAPIFDQFVLAAKGQPDVGFWSRICHEFGGHSGPRYIGGWLSVFCVFDQVGRWQGENSAINMLDGKLRSRLKEFPTVSMDDIPPGYLTVDVAIDDNGEMYNALFFGGHMSFGFEDPSASSRMRRIKNRSAYLRTNEPGGWDYEHFADIVAWAHEKRCESKVAFFGDEIPASEDDMVPAIARMQPGRKNEVIVLKTFTHEYADERGGPATSIGVVTSSRGLMGNMLRCIKDQETDLLVSSDGTYKLHFGQWTLVDVGSTRMVYSEGKSVSSFVPWAYLFVRSECQHAYAQLNETLTRSAELFFDARLSPDVVCMDHAPAIRNAALEEWDEARPLDCWPHCIRNARKTRSKLNVDGQYEAMIKPHLHLLHLARNSKQFDVLGKSAIAFWTDEGEATYAEAFADEYLSNDWGSWHVSASDVPGVMANQNPIEAHHRTIKRMVKCKASTAHVLNIGLPAIIAIELPHGDGGPFKNICAQPVSARQLLDAEEIASDPRNYAAATVEGIGSGYVVNARKYVVRPFNINKMTVTKGRVKRFCESLRGHLGHLPDFNDMEKLFLSLYFVSVDEAVGPIPRVIDRAWTLGEIYIIRRKFKCQCKGYYSTGWLCVHILAVMSLTDDLDLDVALTLVPVRRGPGRPAREVNCLDRFRRSRGKFSQARLIKQFTEKSASCYGWVVARQGRITSCDGTQGPGLIFGLILKPRNGPIWTWEVRYTDGVLAEHGAQALAKVVAFSAEQGVNVTSHRLSSMVRQEFT
ncbi:hypothetical protein SDRG_10435 [Saprolegnia diclina VS20]|uniref:SWIM-type domain-containing protein n=1 Tax=Saprolegnia diclina (strain VS20) TaxID=1156394 RepID=T0RHY8_SAPDV|nr:hypothetical protein SDRG_10435 [Saprolegnia diclina VS20]EQC31918.1 hypothetical protein SDRG_10435 [Saprolegnia diclina VS20]|eukprot:XP_008614646.1 hypothetical protein SDRG_10435 [Saprolegnia diclina VS20]